MVAPGKYDDAISDDADVALTGWDPYIVAITGGSAESASASGPDMQSGDTRELRLMAWLREHGGSISR